LIIKELLTLVQIFEPFLVLVKLFFDFSAAMRYTVIIGVSKLFTFAVEGSRISLIKIFCFHSIVLQINHFA